jgi:hypothetical protein
MSNSTDATEQDTTYNGWTNYETWAAGMFLDGNYDGEGVYRHGLDIIREAAKSGEVGRSTAIADLADAIRELVEENVRNATDDLASGLAADLLGSALGSIEWRELAESRLPEDFYSADELAQWITDAADLGREHATNAASWIVDGNSEREHARRLLAMLRDGDPEAYDAIGAGPNLSGEMADGMTPRKLYEQITGRDADESVTDDDWQGIGTMIEELTDAYEESVSETFSAACERELIAFTV